MEQLIACHTVSRDQTWFDIVCVCRFVLGSFLGTAALVVTTSYIMHSFMPLFDDWQTQEGEKPEGSKPMCRATLRVAHAGRSVPAWVLKHCLAGDHWSAHTTRLMESAYLLGYICAGSCLVTAAVVAVLLVSAGQTLGQPIALPANVSQHGGEFKARTFDSGSAGGGSRNGVLMATTHVT